MATTKEVFIGSFFEFTAAGVEEVIDSHRLSLPASVAPPFITYDKQNNLFSLSCDRYDRVMLPQFIGQLKAYVDQQSLPHGEREIVESPKIRPIAGTVLQDAILLDDEKPDGNALIDHLAGDDTDDENTDGTAGFAHITAYWKPSQCSIRDLPTDLAHEIAQLTGTDLFAEPDRSRVRILGVNYGQALLKLSNLETLLSLLAQQRLYESSRPSGNVLITSRPSEELVIEFMNIDTDAKTASRIIVNTATAAYIDKKYIGERRYRRNFQSEYQRPANLETISDPIEARSSSLWAGHNHQLLGDASNAQPRLAAKPKTASVVDVGTSEAPSVTPEVSSTYIPAKQARQIKSWAATIPDNVDPNEIPVTVPSEAPVRDKRVRKVAVDSDDEEDDGATATPGKAQEGVVPNVEHVAPQQSQRRRTVHADDSDDCTIVLGPRQSDADVSGTDKSFPVGQTDEEQTSPSSDEAENVDPSTGMLVDLADDEDEQENDEAVANPISPLASSDSLLVPMLNASTEALVGHRWPEAMSEAGISLATSATGQQATEQSVSRPETPVAFEPDKYGKPRRGDSHNPSRSRGNLTATRGQGVGFGPMPHVQSGRGTIANASGSPRAPLAHRGMSNGNGRGGYAHGRSTALKSRGRGQPFHTEQSQPRDELLIRIPASPELKNKTIMPPPGFEARCPQPNFDMSASSPEVPNVMDDPAESFQRPPTVPQQSPTLHMGDSASWLAENPVSTTSVGSASYVSRSNPGVQISYLQNQTLAALQKLKEDEEKLAAELARSKSGPRSRPGRRGRERVQAHDEVSSRTFREIMNQKTGNPGKKAQSAKRQTAKEKAERIAQAKAAAHGTVPPSKPSSKVSPRTDPLGEMSARKRQLIKNPDMSQSHPEAAKAVVSSARSENLIEQLRPFFEAGRVFSGKLVFEVQFGQVLLPALPIMKQDTLVTGKQWKDLMDPKIGQKPATGFTNILTRNGAEPDGVLEMKDSDSGGMKKLWDRSTPGPTRVVYEFHCQSKENEEFWLIVDQTGDYYVHKATATIGVVNLHYPEQIWDACAVLRGQSKWDAPAPIRAAAAEFVHSLYVPAEEGITITYRLPTTNDMTVRDLNVQRTSLHNCFLVDRQDFQLQFTEVKRLYHRFRKEDKTLGQAFEKDHKIMMDEDRVHYEMSLIHKGINDVLDQNTALEVGELTDAQKTGAVLLSKDGMRSLLELSTHVVSKIDWVGARNVGTLIRNAEKERADRSRRMQGTAAHGSVVGPLPVRGPLAITLTQSAITSSRSTMNPARAIPGIRQNSSATAHMREDGSKYYLGFGGAQIPIPEEAEEHASPSEVVPDDSVSQVGGAGGGGIGGAQATPLRQTYHTAPHARPGLHPKAPQPAGYW